MRLSSFYKFFFGVILLLCGINHGALAQTQTLKVLNASNYTPVAGATVRIGNKTQMSTNAEGLVVFDAPGAMLKISCVGYKTLAYMPTQQASVVYLEQEFIEIKPLVLVANLKYNAPIAHQNISKEALAANNFGQDMPYLLQNAVSVVTTSDAGTGVGYTGLRIRGSDATRINVTINGIALNDAEGQGVYWVDLPDLASSTQNVQIQRGVGSSSVGAGAFGASINVQTNTQNRSPFFTYNGTAGAFATQKNTLSFGTGLLSNHWIFDARVSKVKSEGYIQRGASRLTSAALNLGYYAQKSNFKATILLGNQQTYQAWYGVPQDSLGANRTYNPAGYYTDLQANKPKFYNNQVDNYTQNHYQFFYNYTFNNAFKLNTAFYATTGQGYYEEYQNNVGFGAFNLKNPNLKNAQGEPITQLDLITQRWLKNNLVGTNLTFNYQKSRFSLDFGLSVAQYKGSHFGNVVWSQYNPVELDSSFLNPAFVGKDLLTYYQNQAQKYDASAYSKVGFLLFDRLNVFADVQVRGVSYRFAPKPYTQLLPPTEQAQYVFLNPKLGANYKINNAQNCYAFFGVANREPSREDMVNAAALQRPSAERLYNTELGYRFRKQKFDFEANMYFMNYKNQLVLTGGINDVGEFTRINVADSYRRGIELSSGYYLKKMNFTANIALSQNKIRAFRQFAPDYATGKNELIADYNYTDISFSPAVVAAANFSYRPTEKLPVVELGVKYVGRQFLDNTSNASRQLNPYFTTNIKLTQSYLLRQFAQEIGWSVVVNNALNALYSNNGYTYSYYYGRQSDPTLFTANNYFPQATRHVLVMFFVKI